MADSVGRQLSRARHSLGLSLKEAESITKIRSKNLQAIEEGHYDVIPETAYLRGYIIAYARLLDLEPEPLLEALDRELGSPVDTPRITPRTSRPLRHSPSAPSLKKGLVALVAILILAGVVLGVVRLTSFREPLVPIPPIDESTVTAEPARNDTPSASVIESPPTQRIVDPQSLLDDFTIRISVKPGSSSWFRVSVDGRVAYEGVLIGGQYREWLVTDSATIRVGRPSAVEITKDGQEVSIPPGMEVPEVTVEP